VSRGIPRTVSSSAVQSLVAALAESKVIADECSARATITKVTTE